MNELKVLLDNFQSISSGELVFKTGLNFIIGQSNSGKTATFRALKACLLNPAGSQRFIKKGHSSATVTMYYNGNEITWKRGQKDSSYTINGEAYLKTGKSNVFKILEGETGFVEGEDSAIMNIEEELQLPFPFGYSKSDLFKLYENVFCISDSAAILKGAKNNEDDTKTEISFIENELTKNKKKLEELEVFKSEVNIAEMESMLSILTQKNGKLENLQDGIEVIKKLKSLLSINFSELPVYENKVASYTDKIKIKKLIEQLKKAHALLKTISVTEFKDYSNSWYDACKTMNEINKLKLIENFTLPTLDTKDLLNIYKELCALKKTVIILSELKGAEIKPVIFEDRLKKYSELTDYLKEIRHISALGKEKTIELQRAKERVQELSEKLKDFKVCPLCHQPLNN